MQLRFYQLLSILVFAVLYIHTAVIVLILFPFAYFKIRSAVITILHFWARSVFWIMGKKLKITGMDNYSRDNRYIIIANHSSLFDIMAIMAIYPNVAWFGHNRLMKVPLFKHILKMINYIPLEAKTFRNTKKMLNEMIQKSKNQTLAIFPEGTRSLNGNMNGFYRGIVYVLKESDADILPVTLNGFYSLKPKNRSFINFSTKLSVSINQPVKSIELKSKSDHEIISQLQEVIKSKIIVNPLI